MALKHEKGSNENSGCKGTGDQIKRRELLKSTSSIAGAAALLSIGGSLEGRGRMACGSAAPPKVGLPRVGDLLVFAQGDSKGKVVSPENLVIGGPPALVQPKDPSSGKVRDEPDSTILLFRVEAEKVPPDLKESSAQGVLAYSAVCTHLGCELDGWDADKKLFTCPCHEAAFDPLQSGKVVSGPGPRPLPLLPLKIDDNKLVVADEFSARVGPQV